MIEQALDLLKKHEGTGPIVDGRLMPYEDSEGYLTIGYGINIDQTGITPTEADYLLQSRASMAEREARQAFDWFNDLDLVRQSAIVNMVYNLGITRFKKFRNTIEHIEHGNYPAAAAEMLDSRWAAQVGYRADELSEMMRTGEWP